MNKINYQKQLDKVIENLGETKPTLLLHSCCAPCSSYVMEYLSQYFDITIDYYNPNIDSKEEYEKRVHEQQRLVSEMNLPIKVIDAGYAPQTFFDMAKGYEQEPEGGKRCYRCYKLRLDQAAKLAQEGGYDYFTTTLTISPLKNAAWLNELGQKAGELAGVRFLPSDFKKKGGYQRSIQLSKEYNLYRQNFCGCVFSKRESEERMNKEKNIKKRRNEKWKFRGGTGRLKVCSYHSYKGWQTPNIILVLDSCRSENIVDIRKNVSNAISVSYTHLTLPTT